jgi:hypothetical protein
MTDCKGCGKPIDYTREAIEIIDGLSWHQSCGLPSKQSMMRTRVVFAGLDGETLVEFWSRPFLLERLGDWMMRTDLKGADRGDHSKVAMDFVNRSGLPLVSRSGLPLWRIAKRDEVLAEEADQTITVRCGAARRGVSSMSRAGRPDVDERESGDLYNCECQRDANGRKVCACLDLTMRLNPEYTDTEAVYADGLRRPLTDWEKEAIAEARRPIPPELDFDK